MKEDGRIMNEGIGTVTVSEEMKNVPWQEFYDDLSGERLNSEMVIQARKKEIVEVSKHNVYKKAPLAKCYDETGKRPLERGGWT